MKEESIIKLILGPIEDQQVAMEILRGSDIPISEDIIGAIYAHVSNSLFDDFLERHPLDEPRLLHDFTDFPNETTYSLRRKTV